MWRYAIEMERWAGDVPVATEKYVVGVDGGATKTIALIGTNTRMLGRGESGSSNYHNIGTVAAGKAIGAAVANARKQARLPGKRVSTAVVALAAIDSAKGVRIARRFVRRANLAQNAFVIHDSVAALYAATKGKPGIIANSGTGCFAAGINRSGQYARVGGWGYLIDDRGSAFDVGMKAITLGFRMMDGRTPRTGLMALLKNRLEVKAFDEILDGIYSNRIGVEEIAELAQSISRAAKSDRFCRQILREAGMSLAELACAAARRLKMANRSFPLTMVGGGFRSGPYFVGQFMSKVREECPRARFVRLRDEPASGAYLIAAKLASQELKDLPQSDRWLQTVVN
jgi:N-acetylglucosamine kinase-like BadF-type ATPase